MSETTASITNTVAVDKVPTISVSSSAQGASPTPVASGSDSTGLFTSDNTNLDTSNVKLPVTCKVGGKGIVREKRSYGQCVALLITLDVLHPSRCSQMVLYNQNVRDRRACYDFVKN